MVPPNNQVTSYFGAQFDHRQNIQDRSGAVNKPVNALRTTRPMYELLATMGTNDVHAAAASITVPITSRLPNLSPRIPPVG